MTNVRFVHAIANAVSRGGVPLVVIELVERRPSEWSVRARFADDRSHIVHLTDADLDEPWAAADRIGAELAAWWQPAWPVDPRAPQVAA